MSARSRADFGDLESRTLRGRTRRVLRAVILGTLRFPIGLRLIGLERIPETGPVLVVANHLHNIDPVLLCAALLRPLHFMAKKEVFNVPVISWLLRWGGSFPVERGKADRGAMRRARATLDQGIALGMFPEGTRSETRSLQSALAGVGLVATMSGCPIVPVAVSGSERLPFNGGKGKAAAHLPWPDSGHTGVHLLFGEPFTIPKEIDGKRVSSEQATEIIMIEIARILPPDYRGVYAAPLAAETTRRALPFPG